MQITHIFTSKLIRFKVKECKQNIEEKKTKKETKMICGYKSVDKHCLQKIIVDEREELEKIEYEKP